MAKETKHDDKAKPDSIQERLALKLLLNEVIWLKREVWKGPYDEATDAYISRIKELLNG